MKHICTFLCLFLLSGVLSSYSNASDPDYFGDCVRTIRYSYTDFVLWNNELPDTERWTPHCWSLVYQEDGKWYFDIKRYGEILLQQEQRQKRRALRWSPENNKKRLWAEQRIVHQMKYGKYNSW